MNGRGRTLQLDLVALQRNRPLNLQPSLHLRYLNLEPIPNLLFLNPQLNLNLLRNPFLLNLFHHWTSTCWTARRNC